MFITNIHHSHKRMASLHTTAAMTHDGPSLPAASTTSIQLAVVGSHELGYNI